MLDPKGGSFGLSDLCLGKELPESSGLRQRRPGPEAAEAAGQLPAVEADGPRGPRKSSLEPCIKMEVRICMRLHIYIYIYIDRDMYMYVYVNKVLYASYQENIRCIYVYYICTCVYWCVYRNMCLLRRLGATSGSPRNADHSVIIRVCLIGRPTYGIPRVSL